MKNVADVDETFGTLLRLLRNWGNAQEAVCEKNVDAFLADLIKEGWRRPDIYDLLKKTNLPFDCNLSNEAINYVCDVESAVTGFVHPDSIMHFPEEEFKDNEEMIAYVRSKAWVK